MEAKPLTAAEIDAAFASVCSQIGDLFCRKLDIEAQLEVLKLKRAQYAAQYQALAHNEKAAS